MRPWLRSVAGGLAPLVASWLPLYYIQVVHLHLIFGELIKDVNKPPQQ